MYTIAGDYSVSNSGTTTCYASTNNWVQVSGTAVPGVSINNFNNKPMKESSKELFTLTFIRTVTTEFTYEVLAESP